MTLSPAAAATWWRDLQPTDSRPGDRGALARLRRCSTVTEAMLDPATIGLLQRCGGTGPKDLPDAGLAAAVLAHVREDDTENRSIARRIGPTDLDHPETALVKVGRFRRIVEATTHDERLTAFRRLVAITGDRLNVSDLARALLRWDDETLRRWTFNYWVQPTTTNNGAVK
jgi:CRISPR system Cascade subunit CasB